MHEVDINCRLDKAAEFGRFTGRRRVGEDAARYHCLATAEGLDARRMIGLGPPVDRFRIQDPAQLRFISGEQLAGRRVRRQRQIMQLVRVCDQVEKLGGRVNVIDVFVAPVAQHVIGVARTDRMIFGEDRSVLLWRGGDVPE